MFPCDFDIVFGEKISVYMVQWSTNCNAFLNTFNTNYYKCIEFKYSTIN